MKKNNIVIIGLFVLSILSFLILNPVGVIKYINKNNELISIKKKISENLVKLENLKIELDSLQNNDSYKEKIIRYQYHMVKPNEDLYKIIKEH